LELKSTREKMNSFQRITALRIPATIMAEHARFARVG
jgi:hypothetical protein